MYRPADLSSPARAPCNPRIVADTPQVALVYLATKEAPCGQGIMPPENFIFQQDKIREAEWDEKRTRLVLLSSVAKSSLGSAGA